MSWYDKKFSDQYAAAREALAKGKFSDDWSKLVRELQSLMTVTGFASGKASALDDLRKRVKQGESKGLLKGREKLGEDVGVLGALGINNPSSASAGVKMAETLRHQAAALKFLRHVYLLKKFGSHRVWVHSLPVDFLDWPHYAFGSKSIVGEVRGLLITNSERFSADDKKHLSSATQHGLRWCHRAMSTISSAKTRPRAGGKPNKSRDMVKRWFADENTTEDELDGFIGSLELGFKSITATINRGRMVFTDFVPLRSASTQDELALLSSEAFVWPLGGREKLDVVYIESEFFGGNNVLTGLTNWTRIVIHELSHLVVGTEDIPAGADSRYAWYGIGPNAAGFPGTDAIKNAENWAFFAGDCTGAISDSERTKALTIK